MNASSYRLVFSKHLGMLVPASELTRARGGKGRGRGARLRRAAAVLTLVSVSSWAQDPNTLPSGAVVRSGQIDFSTAGNTLNVNQASKNGIIHWNSFNIGANATVNFHQPGATAATLNRIIGNESSVIQGMLNADGAVYIINRNGILFDKNSQVNLHSLVASTLDIRDDDLFRNGFLSGNKNSPAFSDAYTEYVGSAPPGMVHVAEGARITATTNGRIILLAPDVENRGIVESPGGQVILAAGHKAYFRIADGTDKSLLRGLTVEVASGGEAVNLGQLAADGGGDVTLIGKLVRQEGVATASTTVNLDGTIHLLAWHIDPSQSDRTLNNTLVANDPGEVRIGANSITAIMPALDPAKVNAAVAAGKLTRQQVDDYRTGKANVVDFYAYMPDTTLQDAQTFNPSKITVKGRNIWVQGGASMVAPAGDITLRVTSLNGPTADDDFLTRGEDTGVFAPYICLDCRLQVDDGARLDVSGLRDVSVAMERNVVTVELRGDELKDSPLLRGVNNPNYGEDTEEGNNPLYGQKIQVDIRKSITTDIYGKQVVRKGTPLADASGYIAQIGRKVDEKSTSAGAVHLYSDGELVVQKGATIDLSGGSLKYEDGTISTSQLLYHGQLVDIAAAKADKVYEGLGQNRIAFEKGYMEGKNAGSLDVVAPWVALQGSIAGSTVQGIHQRGQADGALPLAVALNLGLDHSGGSNVHDYRLMNAVVFSDGVQSAAPGWGEALPEDLRGRILLDPALLKAAGVGRLHVYTNNAIDLQPGQTLDLGPGGEALFAAGAMDIGGTIQTPGGQASLSARLSALNQTLAEGFGWDFADLGLDQRLVLAPSARISSAGLWTNDYLSRSANAPVMLNGGSISLYAEGDMRLEQGSLLDASAGAWLKADGTTLAGGQGGAISLTDTLNPMVLQAELRAFGLLDSSLKASKGGSLTVTGRDMLLGGDEPEADSGILWLRPAFFSTGGFSSYALNAVGDLEVAPDTMVAPRTWTRVLGGSRITAASGSAMESISKSSLLGWGTAKAERPTTNLSLTARLRPISYDGGALTLGSGASIDADPLSSVNLEAVSRLEVQGRVSAPAGSVTMSLNPAGDYGYVQDAAIWLGKDANLTAAGLARTWKSGNGLLQGEVLAGGSISMVSHGGAIVALPGSILDVSGAVGKVDLPQADGTGIRYVGTWVPSAGGSVNLAAAEGILLGSDLRAAGGSDDAARGSLSVQLDRPDAGSETNHPYPSGPRAMRLYGSLPEFPEDPLAPDYNGVAVLAAGQLGHFDHVSLKSRDGISFQDGFDLTLRGRLTVDTPVIQVVDGTTVDLKALYVGLGNMDPLYQGSGTHVPNPVVGTGMLTVRGQLIDLTGNFALSGVAKAGLYSDGDLRLTGVVGSSTDLTPVGRMATAGALHMQATQIYPTSLTEYTLESLQAFDADHPNIVFSSNGSEAHVPLSAGGSMTVKAAYIRQDGVLRAPLGSLSLEAGNKLVLEDGSLTSVSAEGQYIPLGRVENGLSWVYDLNYGTQAQKRTLFSGADGIVDLPEKDIRLKGVDVVQEAGARIDLSGGGDLVGYEFTPGPGGSRDFLADKGVYAILPASANGVAPFDFQNAAYSYASADTISRKLGGGASQLTMPGQSVYLSGIPGLEAGYYTLLPAHYAVLPGAYTVRAVSNTQDRLPAQNLRNPDGSYLVAGYMSGLGTANVGTVRWTGFEVASRETVTSRAGYSFQYTPEQLAAIKNTGRSEITDYLASELITAISANFDLSLPRFGGDAGHLGVSAQNSLRLDGVISFEREAGARGGELDISAPKIAVTSGSTSGSTPTGYMILDVARLNAFNVDSLLLGGVREATTDPGSVYVSQGATDILVDTGTGAALTGPEIMLVAGNSITVADGSSILGIGLSDGARETLIFGRDATVGANGVITDPGVSGDGALLRVASGGQRDVVRKQVKRAGGSLSIGTGASIHGSGSVALDSTLGMDNRGLVTLGDDGSLHVGAARISLGDVTSVSEGTIIDANDLASYGHLGGLVLKSYSTIDVYGSASLGTSQASQALQRLVLQASGILGLKTSEGDGDLTVSAKTVSLGNPDGATFSPAGATGTGILSIEADNIEFGSGVLGAAGFDTVSLRAGGEIAARPNQKGMVSGLDVSGDLTLAAQRLTGYMGSDTRFTAGGKLTTQRVTGAGLPNLGDAPYGGILALSGTSLEHGGSIDMPYGWVTLTARSGDLDLLSHSTVFAGGLPRSFKGVEDNAVVYVPGGTVTLQAALGNVNVEQNATVDVSGKGGSDAGTVSVAAPKGNFRLQGLLDGSVESAADRTGAWKGALGVEVLTLDDGDVATANDFSSLLKHVKGFGAEFNLRQRQGDVVLAAGDTITAERVVLSADGGVLDIRGKIDAHAPEGGWVLAAAGKELYLRDGAVIDARATGDNQPGGEVYLISGTDESHVAGGADNGALVLEDGSQIHVGGTLGYGLGDINAVVKGVGTTGDGQNYYDLRDGSAYLDFTQTTPVYYFQGGAENSQGASSIRVRALDHSKVGYAVLYPDGSTVLEGDIKAGDKVTVELRQIGTSWVFVLTGKTSATFDYGTTSGKQTPGDLGIGADYSSSYWVYELAMDKSDAIALNPVARTSFTFVADRDNDRYGTDGTAAFNGVRLRLWEKSAEKDIPIVHKDGTALLPGEIQAAKIVKAVYDQTLGQFIFDAEQGGQVHLQAPRGVGADKGSFFTSIPSSDVSFASNTYKVIYPGATNTTSSSTLSQGTVVSFVAPAKNTGSVKITINYSTTGSVSTLSNKTLYKQGGSLLGSGDINAGDTVYAVWDGSNFYMVDAAFARHESGPAANGSTYAAGASNDTYTLTGASSPVKGSTLAFTVPQTNTNDAVKLNVNGVDKDLKDAAGFGNIGAGTLQAGDVVYVFYDGIRYRLASEANVPLDSSTTASNKYKVPVADDIGTIKAGYTVAFQAKSNNTGGSTLELTDANGGKLTASLLLGGTDLPSGAIGAKDVVYAYYDGSNFQLMTEAQAKQDVGQGVRITNTFGKYGTGGIGTEMQGASRVEVIANRVTTQDGGTVDFNRAFTDSLRYTTEQSAAVNARLSGPGVGTALHVRPGVEVRSTGDLLVDREINLAGFHFGGEPGTLTLRAAGQLRFSGSLSDGFSTAGPDGALSSADSWSYRLTAGADLDAANPLVYVKGQGDFVLDGGYLIRTGAGSIHIAAGGDMKIGRSVQPDGKVTYDSASVIYTAGKASVLEADFDRPVDATTPDRFKNVVYPMGGGALSLEAGGSVFAPAAPQLLNDWLVRRGRVDAEGTIQTTLTWGIDFSHFNQGVGALGGGNVRIVSGGDITNLSVSLPTVARDLSSVHAGTDLVQTGAGSLDVRAVGDILSGTFYVQRGEGRVLSGGAIGAVTKAADGWTGASQFGRNLLLAMGDSPFEVYARRSLTLESAFNATMVPMGDLASSTTAAGANSYFFTYGQNSRVDLVSAQGNLVLNNRAAAVYDPQKQKDLILTGSTNGYFVYPGSLNAAALNGDLTVGGSFALFPSANGKLHLLASDDVVFAGGVTMSDVDTARLPSLGAPSSTYQGAIGKSLLLGIDPASTDADLHAAVPVHEVVNEDGSIWYDPDPVRVYAELGDIISVRNGASGGQKLSFAKPVEFLAGQDIIDVSFTAQNLNQDQTSYVWAGRDVLFAPNRNAYGTLSDNGTGIRVRGPGYLDIVAGRNIDLGNTKGVIADGNVANPALPYGSADVLLLAGMTSDADGRPRLPEYAAFMDGTLADGSPALADIENQFLDYERVRLALLQPENQGLGYKAVLDRLEDAGYREKMTQLALAGRDGALAAYQALPLKARAQRLFFAELQAAAGESSLMKQLAALKFDLQDLNKLDQAGVADGYLETLANAGMAQSSLEKFKRFFADAARLIQTKGGTSGAGYDVVDDLGYKRADRAIALMFPTKDAQGEVIDYHGDFSGFFSQVRTEEGSNIHMFTPGGSATVGLVSKPADLTRADSTLGIFTINGGGIRSYTEGNFQVNSSRVFTLGWEGTEDYSGAHRLVRDDLVLFSRLGNIDAGKGAKTTSAAPPPRYFYDTSGNLTVDLSNTISGSGIGVLLARDVLVPGDVYLIAPEGEVNAGDAGIRASGNIFLEANRVVGANNIVSVGISVGVPVAVSTDNLSLSGGNGLSEATRATSALNDGLMGNSEQAQKAAEEMKQAMASFKPSFITVEVLGFGSGTASTGDDPDELERKRREQERKRSAKDA